MSRDAPTDPEQPRQIRRLFQFGLNLGNQFLAPLVNLILRIEQRTPFCVAERFLRFDLLLTCQFVFQRKGGRRRATSVFDLTVQVFDFPFQSDFQIIRPAEHRLVSSWA